MHHATKKSAVEKYSPLLLANASKEEIIAAIFEDDKKFNPEEAEEIYNSIIATNEPNLTQPAVAQIPLKGNAALDLSNYNPKNLTDKKAWDEYQEIISKLKVTDQFDFVKYKAKPIRVEMYPGMRDSPKVTAGITILNDTPLNTTRIPVSVALDHNAQIENAHSIAGHGTYFLLKKV